MAVQRIPVSLLVFLCVSGTPILRAQFCSSNGDCQHGGYCNDPGMMGGAEDPNHPHIFESSCVCPETYTGTYCTEPVPLVVDDLESSNPNPFSYDDSTSSSSSSSNDDASLSTGAVVVLSILAPMMLVLGFVCGAFVANKRARIRSPLRMQADSPANAGDGEIIGQESEPVKLEDDANSACEIEVNSEVV
jgi:hypothetical protein